jgi:hypothetical protein
MPADGTSVAVETSSGDFGISAWQLDRHYTPSATEAPPDNVTQGRSAERNPPSNDDTTLTSEIEAGGNFGERRRSRSREAAADYALPIRPTG